MSDRQKFYEEIAGHLGIIHKVCRIYKKETADREDLLQEILYNAWSSYSSFQGRSKFSTWLYRVAINTALHENRKDKFFGKKEQLDIADHIQSAEPENERITLLWLAIGKLDPLERSIVVLYMDELSYKEISEITGLTETNIGVKLTRIKNKIRRILHDYGT